MEYFSVAQKIFRFSIFSLLVFVVCAMQIGKQIVLKYRVLKSELSFSADAGTYMKQLSLIPINYLL